MAQLRKSPSTSSSRSADRTLSTLSDVPLSLTDRYWARENDHNRNHLSPYYYDNHHDRRSSASVDNTHRGRTNRYPSTHSLNDRHEYDSEISSTTYTENDRHHPRIHSSRAPKTGLKPINDSEYPIVMAIDWGTTYSSMAFAFHGDGFVNSSNNWPEQHSQSYSKVPTCNLYKPGSIEILDWGYSAKNKMISNPAYSNYILLQKYKLFLDRSVQTLLPGGLNLISVIADYLRKFHEHAVQEVLGKFGNNYSRRHIQYCLTVPAIWDDNAKNKMRMAAIEAGIISPKDPHHRLILISEPEAAAMYCEKMCDQFQLKDGERFLVCDAGGGTVDLVTFEVSYSEHNDRMLKEITKGSGHRCGSIYLDIRMRAHLEKRLSKWKGKISDSNWNDIMDCFINEVKPLYNGSQDMFIRIPYIRGVDMEDPDIGLEDSKLRIAVEQMKSEVFNPIIRNVLDLITSQLDRADNNCQAILLVGGFGRSNYLLKRVKKKFDHEVRFITSPSQAELAVVKGAVYSGLAPRTISQRTARRWYGTGSYMPFESKLDKTDKLVRDPRDNPLAKDRFSIFVQPGQAIKAEICISKFYRTYEQGEEISSPLYVCSSEECPRYIDSPNVERICDFMIPVPSSLKIDPKVGVEVELRMYFGLTEFRVEAIIGKTMYETKCRFKHDII